ncbi:CGA synthase-related protein [Embleya scabrispora]|uniref:CGA synthase-related protein n=1 Tax=Embleya scabrispora TaxID=159449 RepID=A0A1T3NN26_9ACTN|nr:CGA synthase-related protein [Embleya scabrispora]OPC78061.1 CGA synthase-related protein [Embleya scabrispora]
MAVLTPREGADARRTAAEDPGPGSAPPPAESGRRILLVSRDEHLDSLLARRRIAAHLGDLRPVLEAPDEPPPHVVLVCDDEGATERLRASGVPVVHLTSGHRPPSDPPARLDGVLHRVHRPGWLPDPAPDPVPGATDARPTGLLAPARTARRRKREGTLLLLSAWNVPAAEADTFAAETVPALVRAALRRTGRCDVVCDTRLEPIRAALAGLGDDRRVRVRRAVDVDVDTLHAEAEVFLAAPTLGAVGLARARRAPLAFVPALGAAQRDLAAQVRQLVPIPLVDDPEHDSVWESSDDAVPWDVLDPEPDDLRGAQRVARTLRQLALAPL